MDLALITSLAAILGLLGVAAKKQKEKQSREKAKVPVRVRK